jgi:hypothetical protein
LQEHRFVLGLCPIWTNDVDSIIPSEQADFWDIRPMAIGFPQRIFAIGAARSSGFVPLGELLFHTRIGPNGFAFVAEDGTGESSTMLADSHAAQSVSTDGTLFHVDKEWFRHRSVGLKLWSEARVVEACVSKRGATQGGRVVIGSGRP